MPTPCLARRRVLKGLSLTVGLPVIFPLLNGCGRSAAQNRPGGQVGDGIALEIASVGNQLAFDKPTLTVRAGQPVTLTFRNVSTVFQHNWVVVDGGPEAAEQVNQAAAAAGPDRGYLPENTRQILAYTSLLPSGESDTITFTARNVGEYTYLCTFPGHYLAGMKGTLVVEADA